MTHQADDQATAPYVVRLLPALEIILSPTAFPYASNGRLFKDGQFGRDSLETAEDLLELRPDIARAVIRRLAELQGTVADPRTEEEPGKIHHEYRALVMDSRPVDPESVHIFRHLARDWHLAETEEELAALAGLTNYCTVDATPLYVRLVQRYCSRWGTGIMDETYSPYRSVIERTTIRDSVRAAVAWITRRLQASDLGLLEWHRQTPWAHRFQAWKDGGTSYLHGDGSFANFNGPMASVEVQGLAYDALLAAGSLLADDPAQERTRWAALAKHLQKQTLELLWMPEYQYFAMGLDRDPDTARVRQLRVLTSNAGALLDTCIFDSLSREERDGYVLPVVRRILGEDFLTAAGIRCTSLGQRDLLDYPAYQSSYTVWHKETYDVAKGLRRQGFPLLADELERRLLNIVNLAGPREFIYVLPDGRFGPIAGASGGEPVEIWSTNVPENEQAWTVAAGLAIKSRNGLRAARQHDSRSQPCEEELLRQLGDPTPLYRTVADVERARLVGYTFRVNTSAGCAREAAWVQRHDLNLREDNP